MSENYSIMENAEEFYFQGNQVGILVSHGFTGTTQSIHYLGKRIAEEGYTVYGVRLTGHGTHYEDMEKATNREWMSDVEAGIAKLKETCSEIFVAGLSMGGTLALYLAESYPEISGIMPINAATNLPEMKRNYEQFINEKERFIDGIGSDIKQDGVEELAYAKTPVKSMGEILRLTDLVRADLSKITVPTIVFSSLVDHVVPPENSTEIYKNIASKDKDIVYLENSYHVATLDNDKELIAEKCIAFIGNRLGGK